MKLRFIDENGATGTIHDDLSIESEDEATAELRHFLSETKRSREEEEVTLDAIGPRIVLECFVETSVRKLRVVSATDCEAGWGIPSGTTPLS